MKWTLSCEYSGCPAEISGTVERAPSLETLAMLGWVVPDHGGRLRDSGVWCSAHRDVAEWPVIVVAAVELSCEYCYHTILARSRDAAVSRATAAGWVAQGCTQVCGECAP